MTDETPDTPDWMAQMDQLFRGLADVAKSMRAYYTALVEEGFTEEQALAIVVAWQASGFGSRS